MKESYFVAKVMRQLKNFPECTFAARIESGPVNPGVPDVYLIWKGQHVWLEAKTDTGGLRNTQKVWHQKYKQAGGYVGVIRPKDDLVTRIEEILAGKE